MDNQRGSSMKSVLLRAPLLSRSGYGVHSRQVLRYLLQRSDIDVRTQVVPWGITPWCVNHEDDNGMIGETLSRSIGQTNDRFDVSIQLQLPNEWDAGLADKNIGITAGVETDFSNPVWTSVHCSKMDMVIVPSEHTKKSLLANSYTNTPIKVVPETFFDEICKEPNELTELENIKTPFNFLTVGVLTGANPESDRKNTFFLLKWFLETFKDDPDVGLIIKTNQGRETSIDKKVTTKLLRQIIKEVRKGDHPNVYLLHGVMDRDSMNSLYKHEKVKAFISASRGEGFGLPFIEAAAADLPILATDWSAYTEFLNLGKWIKFEKELVEIPSSRIDNQIFMPGMKWAEVNEADLKAKLKKFRHNNRMPEAWAKELGDKIRTEYSWKNVSKIYEDALGEILS